MLRHTPTVDSLWQEPARRIQPAALNGRKADRTEHVRLSRQAYRASAQILMARLQLFEIHDWSWCPKVVRHGLTDFLETSSDLLDTYEPIRTKLLEAVTQSGSSSVVDLCSGAGGPWVKWTKQGRARVPVTLTDKFPNATTVARLGGPRLATLHYHPQPIDATSV